MNIVFLSEENGCGTTSGMAAVASACTNIWGIKTVLMHDSTPLAVQQHVQDGSLSVCREPQAGCITFIDCGNRRDVLREHLLAQADAVVLNVSQEHHNLDAYFQYRHVFHRRTVYLIHQYHQGSIYNKNNFKRLYRIDEESLGIIPHDPFFRYACSRGTVQEFVRGYIHCGILDHPFYFMQELIRSAYLILKAAGGYAFNGPKPGRRPVEAESAAVRSGFYERKSRLSGCRLLW